MGMLSLRKVSMEKILFSMMIQRSYVKILTRVWQCFIAAALHKAHVIYSEVTDSLIHTDASWNERKLRDCVPWDERHSFTQANGLNKLLFNSTNNDVETWSKSITTIIFIFIDKRTSLTSQWLIFWLYLQKSINWNWLLAYLLTFIF